MMPIHYQAAEKKVNETNASGKLRPATAIDHSLILDLFGAKTDLVYVTVALARQFIPSGVTFLKGCTQQARK